MKISLRAALLVLAAGSAASAIAQDKPEGAATPPQERTKVFAGAPAPDEREAVNVRIVKLEPLE